MCNARNHPPGCNCGWGGGWHQGGYGSHHGGERQGWLTKGWQSPANPPIPMQPDKTCRDRAHPYVMASVESNVMRTLRASWVDPNARCPVCGAGVYFYESPDGGRVYFDELGPPWPKHQCTDHLQSGGSQKRHGVGGTRWPLNGWKPLHDFQLSLIGGGGLHRITGKSGSEDVSLTFRSDRSMTIEVARFRKRYDHVMDLSLLSREGNPGQWVILEGEACSSPHTACAKLAVIEHLPDAPSPAQMWEGEQAELVPTSEEQAPPLMKAFDPFQRGLSRLVEIDDRIRSLLEELAELNEEKTQLVHTFLKPSSGNAS